MKFEEAEIESIKKACLESTGIQLDDSQTEKILLTIYDLDTPDDPQLLAFIARFAPWAVDRPDIISDPSGPGSLPESLQN